MRGEGEEIEGGDVEREEMGGDGEWKLFQHWFERNSVVKGTIWSKVTKVVLDILADVNFSE